MDLMIKAASLTLKAISAIGGPRRILNNSISAANALLTNMPST